MTTLGEDLGRLYEVGFNTGLLRALAEAGVSYPTPDVYRAALAHLRLAPLAAALAERSGVMDEQGREVVRQWAIYMITRGLVAGLAFWQELAPSLGPARKLQIRYLQMRFDGDNSLGTVQQDEHALLVGFLAQLGVAEQAAPGPYTRRGHFLRADTLLLIDTGWRGWRVVSIDLSIFSVAALTQVRDLTRPEVLRQLLAGELRYARSRGQFTRLAIDTSPGEMPFAEGLERYYQAFIREDKETAKLIQAGSYAHSFYEFLQTFELLDERPVRFHVLGYTDRATNALTLEQADLAILARCAALYRQKPPADADWAAERQKVLETIARHAARSFEGESRAFFRKLLATRGTDDQPLRFSETITGFVNTGGALPPELAATLGLPPTLSLRNAHKQLILTALEESHPAKLLFLTGNPGIGKTSSLVEFLQEHRAEGFLFLYISPRTQVNRDLLDKFDRWTTPEDEFMSLYATFPLIESRGGQQFVVAYRSPGRTGEFTLGPVTFVPDGTPQGRGARRRRLAHVGEDEIADATKPNRGVLASVSEAIYELWKEGAVRNIVATVSIQSLKKTSQGDTLGHLEKIFRAGHNARSDTILWDKLQAMAARTKHLIVMVDEITGDAAGPAFLEGVLTSLKKRGLLDPQSGFNTKIVVADASIVEASVIDAHLASAAPERDKIYFRKAPPAAAALELQPFRFRDEEALVIGANSYPASELHLLYRLFIEVLHMDERSGQGVQHRLEAAICRDVVELLKRDPAEMRQVIVYLQDKARLGQLVAGIGQTLEGTSLSWQRDVDYLLIHAALSDEEKSRLGAIKDQVRVIFMTSSASRGLSFPYARHILVAIPGFAVEQNLMEIIQVIYRGRGEGAWEHQARSLIFYLAEEVFYEQEAARARAVQERLLSLVTLLVILKLSLMTRIRGYGMLGTERVLMVPVGGRGVSTAGDAFGPRMESLLRALQNAIRQRPDDGGLREIHRQVARLLSHSEIALEAAGDSYLQLARAFEARLVKPLQRGFDRLLDLPTLGTAHAEGSLLLVPLGGRTVHERYYMQLLEQIRPVVEEELRALLLARALDETGLPEGLRNQLWQAVELVEKLTQKAVARSQRVVGQAEHPDLYYALPMWVLTSYAALAAYFADEPEEPEGQSFRDLLGQLVRARYPAEGVLPIGGRYEAFPWLLFRSHSLAAMRARRFTGRVLLASSAFNVLNLILARSEE